MVSRNIIQISPAEGWYATFKDDDNNTSKMPLVCWAFCKKENDDAGILGMVEAACHVDFAENFSDHKGYIFQSRAGENNEYLSKSTLESLECLIQQIKEDSGELLGFCTGRRCSDTGPDLLEKLALMLITKLDMTLDLLTPEIQTHKTGGKNEE